ncbi:MAG: hypothetical protein AAF573_02525 [Bacteroidota bacterium]
MEKISTYQPTDDELHFTEKIEEDLKNTTGWASFIAIVYLTLVGLLLLWFSYSMYLFFSRMNEHTRDYFRVMDIGLEIVGFLLVFVGVLGMFGRGAYALYQYAAKMKKAILLEDKEDLHVALDSLLNFMKWNGLAFVLSFVYGFFLFQYLYRLGQLY